MNDLDFKAIGLKIKERRKSLGITQESIANALDVNPSHISNIECGRANPSLTTLIKIANLLQCRDRKSTRLNSSHTLASRMPSSA